MHCALPTSSEATVRRARRRTAWARALGIALAAGSCAAGPARAADAPPPPAPATKPGAVPSVERAADDVVAAAADPAALSTLAARGQPDPWLVAEELLDRGAPDLAAAFASAAPSPDVAALPAYVERRRAASRDPAPRAAFVRADAALRRRDPAGALAAIEGIDGDPTTVTGIRIRILRAFAVRARKGGLAEGARRFADAGADAEAIGWLAYASNALGEAVAAARVAGDPALVEAAAARRLAVAERRGAAVAIVDAALDVASAEQRRGAFPAAEARLARALAQALSTGDERLVADVRGAWSNLAAEQGEIAKAIELGEAARAAFERLGDRRAEAAAASNLGIALRSAGDAARAIELYDRALRVMEGAGDRLNAARTWSNKGNAHHALGELARALACHERALEIAEAEGALGVAASMYSDLGNVHRSLGDLPRAVECLEEAVRRLDRIGDRVNAAGARSSLASVHFQAQRFEEALAGYQRALEEARAMGDRSAVASGFGNLGAVHHSMRRHELALEEHRASIELHEALGERDRAARSRGNAAIVLAHLGRFDEARAEIDRVVAEAERLGATRLLADALEVAAGIRLDGQENADAVALARRAVEARSTLFSGLGEQQGASARADAARVFDVGASAAAALGDAEALAYFVERGRAAGLVEALGGASALRALVLPDALRLAAADAERAEARASKALAAAVAGERVDAIRAARAARDAARDRSTALVERMQREAKRAAGVVAPAFDALDAVRARLAPDEVYVAFAESRDQVLALVVGRDAARVVRVGDRDAIERTCAEADLSDEGADGDAALASLRRALVEPLGLPASVRRVLVSPDGPLAYVPVPALFPGVDAVFVPSATVHGQLLAEAAARGDGVLAVGDPAYPGKASRLRSAPLARLPASGDEARAVAGGARDVVLVQAEATEARVFEAIGRRPRWRAVHLACHGLVDAERPLLCALALAPDGDDDGLVFARELLRRRVSADLAVLSACETGRGRVYGGEGLLGLARAFMLAGAPRVLCSLWKVDDEATSALMRKFYDLWNPKTGSTGLGTAEALRAAQEHVRSQEKWKHPAYWAAWVLWGLPS